MCSSPAIIRLAAAIVCVATFAAPIFASDESLLPTWIEEAGAQSIDHDGASGRAYLDSASIHRGDDGLVYFVESSNVARPEDIGKVGLMNDAYDCAKDLKYVCVGNTNWRSDLKSTVNAAREPALPVYRKYLCGDR
jgi:hypothetical protein